MEIIGQITGKYQILERVGQGGMSAIYKATNLTDDSTVALKVLSSTKASDPTFKARFSREIEVLQTLEHPRILPILDYGEIGGQAYIVMPFYEHGTLQDRIDQGLAPEQGAKIINQVSEALEYSHAQGITHRNIKPSNILMDENGNAVLSDFGFEHKSGSSLSPTAEARIGTPAYMSPEQCRGEEIDSRSDQYSLAVVIYQMTTGKLPFDAAYPMALVIKHLNDPVPSPRDINPKVPKKVEAILLKGLSKDPGRRFASVAALNQAIQVAFTPEKSRRSADALRRTRQSSTASARSPRFPRGARVALVLSIMLAVPGAVYGLATFGAGFGAASGNSRMLYSSQDPTEFTAAGYAAQTEIAPPEATLISPEVIQTEVEATQTEIADSQTGEGVDVTPTATGMMDETPSVTPSETPTATPTETPSETPSPTPTPTNTPRPYVPPPTNTPTNVPSSTPTATHTATATATHTATATATHTATATATFTATATSTPELPTIHVGELKKKKPKIEPERWRAEVDIKAVSDGIAIAGATVTGTWTVSGEGVEFSCVTGGRGTKCSIKSGWLTDAMSTTFTVTSITYPGYAYAPWDNVASQITIGKND